MHPRKDCLGAHLQRLELFEFFQVRRYDLVDHLVDGFGGVHVAVVRWTGPVPDFFDLQKLQLFVKVKSHFFRVDIAQMCCGDLGDARGKLLVIAGQDFQDRQGVLR
jgi:hypothetical protein